MTKIKRLTEVENIPEFIESIKDKELLIYEDVQGSKIFVNWDGEKFQIKPKSITNYPLNFVDLTMQVFYNSAFQYFLSLPDYITNLLNTSWWFCFEYFPDNQPANIQYQRLPKNNLILTCIVKGSVYKYNYTEIVEYSNLFDTEPIPAIYKGKLSTKQLEILELYLRTSHKDANYIFGENSFAFFFYKLLNSQINNSFLMSDDNFNDNLEKLIIKIEDNDEFTFEILNPLYNKLNQYTYTDYVDTFSLILLNFLEFVQLTAVQVYKLKSLNKDELYIELICKLFNDYMKNMEKDISKMEIDIPEFFRDNKFKINVELLNNEQTIDYIKTNPKNEYVFKCILGSFYKRRKKPIGIFNDQTVILFNNWVDHLNTFLDNKLKMNKDYTLQKSDVKNFGEFWDLKYNIDSQGDVYPDVYDEFEEETGTGKEKNKKKEKEVQFEPTKKETEMGTQEKPINLEKEELK